MSLTAVNPCFSLNSLCSQEWLFKVSFQRESPVTHWNQDFTAFLPQSPHKAPHQWLWCLGSASPVTFGDISDAEEGCWDVPGKTL